METGSQWDKETCMGSDLNALWGMGPEKRTEGEARNWDCLGKGTEDKEL